MSRRRSMGRLTRQPGRWVSHDDHQPQPEVTLAWWYATRMPEPWDYYLWHQWTSAWAEITLAVCENVWRKQGARLYAAHRDHELRDDLRDWLVVKAVESAADFTPDPWHPNPHLQWAKWLYNFLGPKARHHFAEVVGRAGEPIGDAARNAYSTGFASTQDLDEREAEGGRAVTRHPLHGHDRMTDDPVNVLIRLEELAAQVEDIEREDKRAGIYTTSATGTCIVNLCTRKAVGRNLCQSHYNTERRLAQERGDWEPRSAPEGCEVDGCDDEHHARNRCRAHYQELREQEAPRCKEEGCQAPKHARGLCATHYGRARYAQQGPPCNQEGCTKDAKTRGMCPMHYQRWRAARNKGEAPAP